MQIRLKPLQPAERQAQNAVAKSTGCLDCEGQSQLVYRGPGWQGGAMAFDRVHKGEATQEELYECCSDMVETALQGYNACIMTYGQTGAGLAQLTAVCLLTAAEASRGKQSL